MIVKEMNLPFYIKLCLFSFVAVLGLIGLARATETFDELATNYPVLQDDDLARYKKVFALQEKERWPEADKVIAKIDDKILMGYVLANRYLDSATWKTKSKEAKAWLDKYRDLPIAGRIYDLGKRKGAVFNFRRPKDVDSIPASACGSYFTPNPTDLINNRKFTGYPKDKAKMAKQLMRKIHSSINRGKTLIASNYINSNEAKKLFRNIDIDAAKIALAFLYFTELMDDKALAMIEPTVARSGHIYPMANWVAGLIYWRSENYEKAYKSFKLAAKNKNSNASLKSASAYWASRSADKLGKYSEIGEWLSVAAEYDRYFYGVLAQRSLGYRIDNSWEKPASSYYDEEKILEEKAVKRAIALAQLGYDKRAKNELLKLYVSSNDDIQNALVEFTEDNGLPELSDTMISIEGSINDASSRNASFPAPHWKPLNGWKAEKALVYAFVRQESCFNSKAVSGVGARGLMQLMPATARETARIIGLKWSREKLFDPAYNLELGQAYILRLVKDKFINNNLMFLAVAYNSGPGNLYKWVKRMHYKEDPLLFMESIPSKETRTFVEKILVNYWIYSTLFSSDGIDTLDQIIEGEWPIYSPDA